MAGNEADGMATNKESGFTRVNLCSAFTGVNQAKDGKYLKKGEAPEAYNAATDGGVLSPARGFSKHISVPLPAAPVTPMLFFHYASDGAITKYLLVTTANDLYCWTGSAWTSIKGGEAITNGDFSYANYVEKGVSKIILSNGADPVYQWTGSGSITKLYYDDSGEEVKEAPRAKCIAIHMERLWAGGVNGFPNTVFASDGYAPSNWEMSAYGAGYITVSAWDGGHVQGLAALLGDLVVFRPGGIFRIVGAYPGEFGPVDVLTVEGTVAPRTICQYDDRAYFLSDDGIMVYDTAKAYELIPNVLRDFWAGVNLSALSAACGIAHNRKLYFAVPHGKNQTANNYVIEYDLVNKTVMIRSGISVTRFLEDNEDLLFVGPGKYVYKYGDGTSYDGNKIDMTWYTPRTDFGVIGRKFAYDLFVTGYTDVDGGSIQATLCTDGTWGTPKTLTLPKGCPGVVKTRLNGRGRSMQLKIQNVDGAPVHILSLDYDMDALEDL
jgi:hypothetical protein